MEEAKWYVLHTFSGYENVAKTNLENVIEKFNLQDRILDIIIPMEDVVEEKNGKKVLVQKKVMPSYLITKMVYGDDIWHNITRTRGITGFVGPKGRPLALTEEEVRKLHLPGSTNKDIELEINDTVEIVNGALQGFKGIVTEIDKEKTTAKLLVEMFGRDTPVTVQFDQIAKVEN